MTNIDIIAIMAVLLIGVPHGGLDGAVARRVGWPATSLAWIWFNLCYVIIATLVAGFWWLFPTASLGLFLVISALHFGVSDVRQTMETSKHNWLPILAHGGLVPVAIPSFQPEGASAIFKLLVGNEGANRLMGIIDVAFYCYLLIVCAYILFSLKHKRWQTHASNLVFLLVCALWLSPLVSFSLYFCFWHSRVHMLRIWNALPVNERFRSGIEAVMYSFFAWCAGAVILWYFPSAIESTLVQLTFIGLAALTVPHMILVDFVDSKIHRLIS
jgi:Brp/Blh family beta-carotene 15,15'-monooxygenase